MDANAIPFQFLESKRTNMRIVPHTARCGFSPQEDQGDVTADIILGWIEGNIDMDNFRTTSNLLDRKDRKEAQRKV